MSPCRRRLPVDAIDLIVHAPPRRQRGARAAIGGDRMITTHGFRDIIELGRRTSRSLTA